MCLPWMYVYVPLKEIPHTHREPSTHDGRDHKWERGVGDPPPPRKPKVQYRY